MPFQPFAVEKLANRRRGLQDQADVVFGLVVKTLGDEGEIVELLAEVAEGLGVFWRFLFEVNGRAVVFFLLRPANAVDDFLEKIEIAADGFGDLVEKAAGVDAAHIGVGLDLFFVEPVVDRPVLEFGGELVGIAEVDVVQLGLKRCSGWRTRGCLGSFELDQLALGVEVFVEQLFDEEKRGINHRRGGAFGAGDALSGKGVGLLIEQAAFVTAQDGHVEGVEWICPEYSSRPAPVFTVDARYGSIFRRPF